MSERPERHWDGELGQWVYDSYINEALDAAQLAITEYHNGDRAWATRWLIRAHEVNQKETAK